MDNKNKANPTNESSLLLKYPINLFSPSSNNENLFMPVGVPEASANTEGSNKARSSPSPAETRPTSSICQLEQPLLFGGITKSNQSNVTVSSTPQVSSVSQSGISSAPEMFELPLQENTVIYSQTQSTSHTGRGPYSQICHISSNAPASFLPEYNRSFDSDYANTNLEPFNYAATSLPEAGEPYALKSQSSLDFSGSELHGIKTNQHYSGRIYDPVQPYWLFSDIVESKEIWYGFSEKDSKNLETAYQLGSDTTVPTDGGRCDVYLHPRKKKFVYFDSKELHVRRCTWFYQQGSSMRSKPYDENTAACLEEYYHKWITSGTQDMRFVIPGIIGSFLFEKPSVMLHYGADANTWVASSEPKGSPKIVKRGLPEGFEIMPNESPKIDHLLFIVQGIGSFCDLRFRTVAECVDGFRDIANKLISSHFRKEVEQGYVGRVEILPVAWHTKLRTSDIGLDRTMKMITLPSIPKLRHFTNDTLIDILLYSSPSYCQSIIDTVAQEINNLYQVFLSRNPDFNGKVFVAGHSLGSLILFDILSNQKITECILENAVPETVENTDTIQHGLDDFTDIEHLLKSLDLEEYVEAFNNEKIDLSTLVHLTDEDLKNVGLPIGHRRKLMNTVFPKDKSRSLEQEAEESTPNSESKEVAKSEQTVNDHNRIIFPLQKPNTETSLISYPKLHFHPAAFFAMGSPISMFLAIRGFDTISEVYSFPTCPAFFHIFHPYDPVAFRIEPMIDHNFVKKPALIPHHKGRKRMHLEIKENVAKFANELRQKVMDTLNKTWHSFNELTGLQPYPAAALEQEVNSMVSQEIPEITTYDENISQETPIGNLNGGRRIDYVLQEKPLEALNDYVWALTSHATYWDSEDTVLMILREIYAIQGIQVSPLVENESFAENANEKGAQNDELFVKNPYLSNFPVNVPSNAINITSSNNVVPIYESGTFMSSIPPAHDLSVAHQPLAPPPLLAQQPLAPPPLSAQQMLPPSALPAQHPLAPPPLSGFVKKSAFSK